MLNYNKVHQQCALFKETVQFHEKNTKQILCLGERWAQPDRHVLLVKSRTTRQFSNITKNL